MPIHLNNIDIVSRVEGYDSALIVSCNMCAGASEAMRENKPFIQFFGSGLISPPLKNLVKRIQFQLSENGVKTNWYKGGIIQQFFLCLWTSRQRKKLHELVKEYEAVIVLGCDSAIETAQDCVEGTGCAVIKGMDVGGIMNTKTKFHLPCNISFEDTSTVTCCDRHCKQFRLISQQKKEEDLSEAIVADTIAV